MDNALHKHLIWSSLFIMAAVFISLHVPTIEMAWVIGILLLTIYLFAFEVVRVDIAAISVMVLLGLTSLFAPLMQLDKGLVDPDNLFNGFSSNAVVSIIAVMIIGAGLDKTGAMSHVANWILKIGGSSEKRVIPLISGTVGVISSFMQNIGAAALFLPVVSRISARTHIPMSRLLMPMGFCAIIGGTITLVGSSPLILLNDLIDNSNDALPQGVAQIENFGMFDVTPIGLTLLAVGIIYFLVAGKFILPVREGKLSEGGATHDYFVDTYGLQRFQLYEITLPDNSPVIGQNVDDIEAQFAFRVVGIEQRDGLRVGSEGINRQTAIDQDTTLCVMSSVKMIQPLIDEEVIAMKPALTTFNDAMSNIKAGIAEIVIPPGSSLIGKSARDVWLRKTYGLSLLAIHRGDETINCQHESDVRNEPFKAGDALVVHTMWSDLARLEKDSDFVVVTTEYPHEELRPQKVMHALAFFVIALTLLFLDVKLSVALMAGALGMVLTGVLTMDEAYRAVSWKTVFLLASLIPLGSAVENTETAKWIAERTLDVVGGLPVWAIQLAVAALATFFTLVMSNIGATILLVPLAINIALSIDASPAMFALTVGLATSNSFILPTHQVNALIMGPAGYKVKDFMRAGSIMTVLFLLVTVGMLNLVF